MCSAHVGKCTAITVAHHVTNSSMLIVIYSHESDVSYASSVSLLFSGL